MSGQDNLLVPRFCLPSLADVEDELDAFARSLASSAHCQESGFLAAVPHGANTPAGLNSTEPRPSIALSPSATSGPSTGLRESAAAGGSTTALQKAAEEVPPADCQQSTIQQPRDVPDLPAHQNGRRAAAQLRPVKLVKPRRGHSILNKQLPLGGKQAALSPGPTSLTPFQRRPTTDNSEAQLAHVMSSLQQPQIEASRLRFLQQAAAARGIGHPRTAHLQAQNLQGLQPHPGWYQLVPAQGGIMTVYKGIAQGCMSHILKPRVLTAPASLAQLAAMPFPAKMDMLEKVSSCIKSAQRWHLQAEHAAENLSLELTGDFVLLGAVFFNTSTPDMLRDQRPLHPSAPGPHSLQTGQLGMSFRQLALAQCIYVERNAEMARIASERAQLLQAIASRSSATRTGQPCTEAQLGLQDAVAVLSDNAAEQQEVWLHAMRRFIFQVCSPMNIQNIIMAYYPRFPDLPGALQLLAENG